VIAQATDLATMPSTNWYLEHASTQILNGMEGSSREEARPFAIDRIRTYVRDATGVELGEEFGLAEGLDRLAAETGAVGWLEKTPLHVLSIPEIEGDIPDARFVHFIRDPDAVVLSLVRRARANPAMFGARHQLDQKNNEATWRACVRASLAQHGRDNHLLVYSEAFVDDAEAVARRIADFLDLPYRRPDDPARVAAAAATVPSHRPWKRDAADPVRRMEHEDDTQLEPLDPDTEALWLEARTVLGVTTQPATGSEKGLGDQRHR
jgi:hypothetical protein